MKKVTLLLFLSAVLAIVSCEKDDQEIPTPAAVDQSGLTQDIRNLVPQYILDSMREMGMPIYGGTNPPEISGTYMATLFERINSSIANDYIEIDTNAITFSNQNNSNLTISTGYYVHYIYPAGLTETGSGLGSFIVGNDCKFSVFVDAETNIQGHTAKAVIVISGEVGDRGITNLHWANYMVDDHGDPGNVFIDNGQGRVFRDKDGWSDRTDITTPASQWYERLPDCPCNYIEAQQLNQTNCPEGEWSDCGSANQNFHYGATNEVRWYSHIPGRAGQQCTYDSDGKLITKGIAAGSPDRSSPMSCGFWTWLANPDAPVTVYADHRVQDMIPWQTLPCWQYLRDWPANHGQACAANVISGIEHMQTMIGNMTCEEATLLIRKAKETPVTVIDGGLRGFIIGEPSPLTNSQVKVKLQNWRDANNCSSTPADALCIVINKAIANLP